MRGILLSNFYFSDVSQVVLHILATIITDVKYSNVLQYVNQSFACFFSNPSFLPFLYHRELTCTDYIFKAAFKQADRKHSQDMGE